MLCRGRLIFWQYVKNKCHKYGTIFFKFCQYDRIVLRISIYPGQPHVHQQNLDQSGPVVLHLVHEFHDKRFTLLVYRYYNSVPLAKYLTTKSTYICFTLRIDRENNPKEIKKAKFKKGDLILRRNGEVVVGKLKTKRCDDGEQ